MSPEPSEQDFEQMNRYDGRHDELPSKAVYVSPRRTMHNYWAKFHADRDCGERSVYYIERINYRTTSERHEYKLYCHRCGHAVPETEVLFIGGDWYSGDGWLEYGRGVDDLFIPPERVLELGPDPDEADLREALRIGRTERQAQVYFGLINDRGRWRECADCGHTVPVRFDGYCRMCYDGPWTDRLQGALDALERQIREHHNNSFVHRLENHVDPLSIGGTASPGTILWRRHADEPAPKLVEVTQRLEDMDSGHVEYVLADMTHTTRTHYHEDDLADCFWDTGLRNDEAKPVMDDRIREVYQRVHDHLFRPVHDPDTGDPDGEQCIMCRKRKPL